MALVKLVDESEATGLVRMSMTTPSPAAISSGSPTTGRRWPTTRSTWRPPGTK